MKLTNFLSVSALMTLAVSCGSSDDPKPVPNLPAVDQFAGIVFATSITNPEGNSGTVYLQTLTDMLPGTYGTANSLPAGFGSTPIVLPNGNIYTLPAYMGSDKAEVNRYRVDGNGKFVKQGTLSIPANAAACNIVELNDEKAYISFQNLGIVMAFNPSTMTKLKDIGLSHLKHDNTKTAPACMIVRDGLLYVGLNQMDANWMPTLNTIELALIDTKTDELKKHIVNKTLGMSFATRPVDPNSIFMDENKDIYFNCVGSFGMIPGMNAGIARIKAGSDEIDPDYCIRMDQTKVEGLSLGYFDHISVTRYHRDHQLYAYGNAYKLDPKGMESPYTSMTNLPCIIDLQKKTIKVIEGMEVSNPQLNAVSIYKDLIVFGSANKKANGFYTYNPQTKAVEGPVMNVQGNPCLFYSYVK